MFINDGHVRRAKARKARIVFEVRAGSFVRHYAAEHHAEQMARALRLNGMDVTVKPVAMPDDALTALVSA